MRLPNFTADSSLYANRSHYRQRRATAPAPGGVVPAIPACANCDDILDNCERNNWRPRAVCNACASGYCYEEQPMPNPFPDPFQPLPRFPRRG
jgi:hypothetical protein